MAIIMYDESMLSQYEASPEELERREAEWDRIEQDQDDDDET